MMPLYRRFSLILITFLVACEPAPTSQAEEKTTTVFANPPAWASEVIWYQIMVERFRNGDPTNDPTPADLTGSYPGFVPDSWSITPWTQDWYAPDPWFSDLEGTHDVSGYPMERFGQKAQLRRYGGDLQGVMDKIGYLDSLGVTAIFFNPLNDAPSLHKYDARNWRHIDRNFGPDPVADQAIIARENPADPTSWQWTAADQLFLKLVDSLHDRGIRVILDYSWNHTGTQFWAFDSIQVHGAQSQFADWYRVDSFDDPATEDNEFTYTGWLGVPDLPEMKETVHHEGNVKAYGGNLASESLKAHIFAITRRWLDPNGDGNPKDGIDGFRLDVAGELPLGFWREYRQVCREVNPECYLVGEIWWEEYPDKLLNPQPFLEGDVFDAVMNYRWYRSARHFFAAAPDAIPVTEFIDSLQSYSGNLREVSNEAMMNLIASHDAPRVSTSLYNDNAYKVGANPNNPDYKIDQPGAETLQIQWLLLVHQFTFVGAPHIWAGDEMGMWGADDPDCRKPLIWPDMDFEPERVHPLGLPRPVNQVKFDRELFELYRQLARLRRENPVLSRGALAYVLADDQNNLLAYTRYDQNQEILVVFNLSEKAMDMAVPARLQGSYVNLLEPGHTAETQGDSLKLTLGGRSAAVWKAVRD